MKIVIDIPDNEIPTQQDIISVELHCIDGKIFGCNYPFAEFPNKGKWIHWTDDYKDYCTCSKCGYGEEGELLLKNITPFCPYCGSYNGGREDAD